jgi:hypothetical protein
MSNLDDLTSIWKLVISIGQFCIISISSTVLPTNEGPLCDIDSRSSSDGDIARVVRSAKTCCVFFLCFLSSCVPYVASFSGLSNLNCPFGIQVSGSVNGSYSTSDNRLVQDLLNLSNLL